MFLYSSWLQLPLATRFKLADAFSIPKKGATEVFSNTISKDGYEVKDIEEKMTVEAMQDYLGLVDGGEDVNQLFTMVVEKINYVPLPPIVQQEVVTKTTVTETVVRPIVEEALPIEKVEESKETLETAKQEITHAETKKSSKK